MIGSSRFATKTTSSSPTSTPRRRRSRSAPSSASFKVFRGPAPSSAPSWFDYYRIFTMHGVLMALVFTTFFITGLSLFVTYRAIPRERNLAVGWFGWWLMLIGTAMAAVDDPQGRRHRALYVLRAAQRLARGFTSARRCSCWARGSSRSRFLKTSLYFRKTNPGQPVPLVVFCYGSDVRHVDRRDARRRRGDGAADSVGVRMDARASTS